jgi:ADP-ribosylglycohydrolase
VQLTIDLLPDRVTAALLGAAAGEAAAGVAAGTRQLLDLAESIADRRRLDEADLRARGLDTPPASGASGLVLRATACGLASPLDRPRLRRDAHRSVRLAQGDEGTAITAVAAAVLAADLCRFDLELALVRLRQTLLEEAPLALHARLQPLDPGTAPLGSGDPGSTLQLAITALDRAATLPEVIDEAASYGGETAAAIALAGVLAGARTALAGCDSDWLAAVPARERAVAVAARLTAPPPPG